MSNERYLKYKEYILNWHKEHKEHICEYSKNYIKTKCLTDEEFKKKRNEQVKQNMRRMRAEQKAKKILEGWKPGKRGPKPKAQPQQEPETNIII